MTNDSLTCLTLAEARDAIRAGKLSPLELTQAHLARVEALNPRLNAYLEVTADTALAEARAATVALAHAQADSLAPLHGLPLALKDLFDVRGLRTTAGSILFKDNLAAEDAFVTARLRQAGAVLLGKLNLHEWALGVTTNNPHFGPCRNPWDTDCIPGGSSGGSGAALAAELCLGSLGSDTGGSIRIPASLCGLVGLKPTYGRVSLRGVVPLSWSQDHVGPMARTVQDAAILLQVIAGYDPDDPYSAEASDAKRGREAWRSLPAKTALQRRGRRKWKVGLPDPYFFSDLHPDTEAAVRAAIETIEELGCEAREVSLEGHEAASRAGSTLLIAEAAAYHHDRMRDPRARGSIGEDVLTRFRWGEAVTGPEYALARRTQVQWRRKMARLFETIDLLVLPATPIPAPRIADSDGVKLATGALTRFTRLFNLTGNPALVLPCGFTVATPRAKPMPIGLQIVGPAWGESKVLQLAHAYEQATEWHNRRPPLEIPGPS